MRKSLTTIGTSLAAAAVFGIPIVAASPVPASPVSPAQVVPARQQAAAPIKKGARREAHPEIRKAIKALERAKYDLQHARKRHGNYALGERQYLGINISAI